MSILLKEKKAALIGLDNGGKKSIFHFLEKKVALGTETRLTLSTEIKVQRISLLSLKIFRYDFKTQKKSRKKNLKEKVKNYLPLRLIIFVIDIQDTKKYNDALDYLNHFLKIIKELNQNCKIFVLFHKYDPSLVIDENINKNCEELKQKILKFSLFKNIRFYKTSIHNEIFLLSAFSDMAICFLLDKTKLIQDLLNTYCKSTFSKAAILFDSRNFLQESKVEKKTIIKALEIIGHIYSKGMEELDKYAIETLEIVSMVKYTDLEDEDLKANIFVQKLDLNIKLFLISLSTNSETKYLVYEHMKILTEKLIEIFNE